jgi:hypothetical protein
LGGGSLQQRIEEVALARRRDSETKVSDQRRSSGTAAVSPLLVRAKELELGDMRQIRTLGLGAFGRVKLVEHLPTHEPWALKFMGKAQIVAIRQVHTSCFLAPGHRHLNSFYSLLRSRML